MANKAEMELKDFVEAEAPGFGPGSRASEQVLQEDVDKAAERYKTIKDAKKAIKRIKLKETAKKMMPFMPGPVAGAVGSMAGLLGAAGIKNTSKDPLTEADSFTSSGMKKGGSVMSRGCKMGRNKLTKIY